MEKSKHYLKEVMRDIRGLQSVMGKLPGELELLYNLDDLKPDVLYWATGQAINATYNITGKLVGVYALVKKILEFRDPEYYAKVVHFRNKL